MSFSVSSVVSMQLPRLQLTPMNVLLQKSKSPMDDMQQILKVNCLRSLWLFSLRKIELHVLLWYLYIFTERLELRTNWKGEIKSSCTWWKLQAFALGWVNPLSAVGLCLYIPAIADLMLVAPTSAAEGGRTRTAKLSELICAHGIR